MSPVGPIRTLNALKLRSRSRVTFGRTTKSVPIIGIILVGPHLGALPKGIGDKSQNREEGKQRQKPIRHDQIRYSRPLLVGAVQIYHGQSEEVANWPISEPRSCRSNRRC